MRRQERKNGDLSSSALLTRKLFVVVCRLVDDERARRPSIEIFDWRGPSLLFWIILKDEVCPGNQLLSSPINAAHIVKRIKSKTLESLPTILFLSWVSYLILIRRFLPNLIFFLIFPFFVYIAGNLGNWANRSMTHSRRAIYFSFELFMNRNHFFVHYCSWIFCFQPSTVSNRQNTKNWICRLFFFKEREWLRERVSVRGLVLSLCIRRLRNICIVLGRKLSEV